MPLWILTLLVLAGVGLVIVAVLYSGGRRSLPISGRPDVLESLRVFMAGAGVDRVDLAWCGLAEGGMLAFFELRDGTFGLVRARGKRRSVRVISQGEVREAVLSRDGFTLTFKLADWTWPQIAASFEDVGVATYARDRLTGLMADKSRSASGQHKD